MQSGHVSANKSVSLRNPPRWLMVGAMTFLCFCLWTVGHADDQKKDVIKEPTKDIWARKLDHAQKVLAAVAQDDPRAVVSNAEELIKISNDLAWKKYRSERYEELSREYRREAQGLITAAKAKNNEAMALGYVKMSLACFNCHNHVRAINIAGP